MAGPAHEPIKGSDFSDAVFNEFPVIKTNRLTLRQMRDDDANAMFEIRSNRNVNRFISRGPMQTVEEAVDKIKFVHANFNEKKGIAWAVNVRENEKMIGAFGYHKLDVNCKRAELGGEMHPDYWGKNIALEAVNEIVRFGLEKMDLQTVEAWLSPKNRGAVRLLETLGFKKEGHLTNYIKLGEAFSDMAIYALHPEWYSPVKL